MSPNRIRLKTATALILAIGPSQLPTSAEATGRESARSTRGVESRASESACAELGAPRPESNLDVGDVTKKAVRMPRPRGLPPLRQSAEVRADIVADVVSGRVVWAQTVSGHPLLQRAIQKVVCQVRFSPTIIENGAPIRVSGCIIYHFGRRDRTSQSRPVRRTN
jgi:hypothetical protein